MAFQLSLVLAQRGSADVRSCQSCNTRERPEFLYPTDVLVGSRYESLFGTQAEGWMRHWHRCLGCRTRTTLPLPHLAALTANLAATAAPDASRTGERAASQAVRSAARVPLSA